MLPPQLTMYISHFDYHSKIQFCHIRNQSLIFSLDVLGTCLIVRDTLFSLTITLPPSFYYIPDFISEAEETNLLRQIENSPTPRFVQRAAMSKTTSNRWTQLANRRLQNWGGVPHPKGMLAEPLPSWLSPLVSRVAEVEVPASDDKQQR